MLDLEGKHCALCSQFDTLAKACEWCNSIFCKHHFMPDEHDCQQRNLERENLFPTCPLCNKKLKVKSGDDTNNIVNEHLDSGCIKYVFKKERKRPCSHKGCDAHKAPIQCPKCHHKFCVTHRFPDDHNCFSVRKTTSNNKKKTSSSVPAPVEPQKSVHPLLAKLGFGARKKKKNNVPVPDAKKKKASKRTRKKRNRPEIQRMKMKGKAHGNKNIDMEDRYYLEIWFSDEINKEALTMFFNRIYTVGRVLDIICKERSIVCKNHIPTERKMILFCQRTNGTLPTSLKLEFLEPQVMSGDTITLMYEDELSGGQN